MNTTLIDDYYLGPCKVFSFKRQIEAQELAERYRSLGVCPNLSRLVLFTSDGQEYLVYTERGVLLYEYITKMKKVFSPTEQTWDPNKFKPSDQFKKLFEEYFRGVGFLHENEYVHGDIDAGKLFVAKQGNGVVGKISGLEKARYIYFHQEEEKKKLFKIDLMTIGGIMGSLLVNHEISLNLDTCTYNDLIKLEVCPEAFHLLQSIENDSVKTAEAILDHPLFWHTGKRLDFLQDCSEHICLYRQNPRFPLASHIQAIQNDVLKLQNKINTALDNIYGGWKTRISHLANDLRGYNDSHTTELIRGVRNKSIHRQELSPAFYSSDVFPEGRSMEPFFSYYFPDLLIRVYNLLKSDLGGNPFFRKYY